MNQGFLGEVPVKSIFRTIRTSLWGLCLLALICGGCGELKSGSPATRLPRQLIMLDSLDWSVMYLEARGLRPRRIAGSVRIKVANPDTTAEILAGACLALRKRLNIISANVANSEMTRTPGTNGDSAPAPYKRQVLRVGVSGALEVVENKSAFRKAYQPGHPDADKNGNLQLPNVYVAVELHDWQASCREYEVLRQALNRISNNYVAPPPSLFPVPVPPKPYRPKNSTDQPATEVKPLNDKTTPVTTTGIR